jgi:hypothetical protein
MDVNEVCRNLDVQSYAKNGKCHGLVWIDESHTSFCMHTSNTAVTCPDVPGREVLITQAVEYLIRLGIIQLPRETTRPPPDRPVRPIRHAQMSIDDDGSGGIEATLIGDQSIAEQRQS